LAALAAVALLLTLGGANAGGILIEHVTVIDGTGAAPIPNAFVLIEGNRIAKVRRTAPRVGNDVRRIDGRGKYLIPGLMDMHIHLRGGMNWSVKGARTTTADFRTGIRALHGYIYSGITSVFDAGNNPDFIFELRRRERAGEIVAPRIFATGGIVTVPGGHGSSTGATLVESWPQAKPALDAHIARKPDLLKMTYDEHNWGTRPLIPLLPLALMQHIIEYYNDHGIRTTVHASNEYRARQAIYAGIDTLAHPVIQSPVSDRFVKLMAAKKIPMVSTLTIGEGYSRLVEHPEFLDQPIYQATFEPQEIARLKGKVRDQYAKRSWTTWMKVMTPVAQENLRRINAAGGIIVLGSDQSNGPASHRELELLVAGGVPALDAIRIGTLDAAIFLGKEREMGSIEDGKLADMLLLDADPLADINNAKKIAWVMKAGVIVDRSKLDLPVNR